MFPGEKLIPELQRVLHTDPATLSTPGIRQAADRLQ